MQLNGFLKYQIKKGINHLTISQKNLKKHIWVVKMVFYQDISYFQEHKNNKVEIDLLIDQQIEILKRLQKLENTVARLVSQEII